MERKLTAILCADVHGYSRLMRDDEEATFRTLASHRRIIDALIEEHHGRFVNSAGDSVLAEFASVVNAVQCGIDIQVAIKADNANLAPDRRMEFRIGINLGDVIIDGEQIYGDGVNVAARIEGLSEPSGICVSDMVYAQIRNKLTLRFQDLGNQRVKNIAEPVRVFRVLAQTETPILNKVQVRQLLRPGAFSLAGIAIIIVTIVLVQHLSLKPPHTSASIPSQESSAMPLPSIPSIAVLPFANLSGDRSQEYFSDGLTDNLITSLSRLPGVFVIAHNSSFFYKGKVVTLQQVGRELGVRTVLQGSVLRTEGRIRIDAQLADASNGANIWAQNFDHPIQDIFAAQDEIVREITTVLGEFFKLQSLKVPHGGGLGVGTNNLEAFDNVLRGARYYWRLNQSGNAKAQELFEKATKLDPKYADAYANLGWTYSWAATNQWSKNPAADLDRASALARQALALDDSNIFALGLISRDDWMERKLDEAVVDAEHAVALNPNYAMGYLYLGEALTSVGQPEKAIASLQKAIRLDPESQDFYAFDISYAYVTMGRYEEARPLAERFAAIYPNHLPVHIVLCLIYREFGRAQEASAQAAEVMRLSPRFRLPPADKYPLKDLALVKRQYAELHKAGLN